MGFWRRCFEFIKITGAVPAAGITDPNTVLLEGTFGIAKVIYLANQAFSFNIAGAVFQDTKNPALLEYFGIPAGTPFLGSLNLSFLTTMDKIPPAAFASNTIGSGDVLNVPAVPIPPSLLLLGTGLVGLMGLGYRRKCQD